MNCSFETINSFINITDKCNFVSNNCSEGYINFYSIHYCYLKGSYLFSSLLIIIILIILFFLLSSTADIFLSTSISKIVEIFHINQNIAAATLLAFGNGAPDVVSSLVASDEDTGISFSICNLIGSGMFVTSFVLGSVVFKGKDILVNSNMFNREILIYLISLFHIIFIGIKKKITFLDSLIFILIYSLNIICAFYQGRKLNQNNSNNNNMLSEENKLIIDEILNDEEQKNEINNNPSYKLGKEIELITKRNTANDFYQEYMNVPLKQKQTSINEQILGEVKEDILNSLKEQKIYLSKSYSETFNENVMLAKIKLKKKFYHYKETKWGETNFFWKFFYLIIDFPLTFIRELTIPIIENKQSSNNNKLYIFPITNFIFLSYVFECKFISF
jgi:Ca2+/Na+ antiporter